ncbi:Cholesterol oxidase [Streptomyces alboniger]
MSQDAYDYDVIVVGSGFGGSVTALRLTEKGYTVGVLEAGRRFTRESLPKNSWDLKNYLWAPKLGMYGIQRIHLLGNVMVLAGAGVGGGSLNYANTLYVPPKPFFDDPQWRDITNWQEELAPYYDQARRMLGVRLNPTMTPSDVHLKAAAERMGVGDSFHMAPVGVFFGDGEDADGASKAKPGEQVPDPYFGGAGPDRKACNECGECMIGLSARRDGHPATRTTGTSPRRRARSSGQLTTVVCGHGRSQGGFAIATLPTVDRCRDEGRTFKARRVVLAAGTLRRPRTLLHRMKLWSPAGVPSLSSGRACSTRRRRGGCRRRAGRAVLGRRGGLVLGGRRCRPRPGWLSLGGAGWSDRRRAWCPPPPGCSSRWSASRPSRKRPERRAG